MATPMALASARVLNGNELGTNRYNEAEAQGTWPVELRVERVDTTPVAKTSAGERVELERTRDGRAWRAALLAPEGHLSYEVFSAAGAQLATGSVEVHRPERATTTNRFGGTALAPRAPSCAVQTGARAAPGDGATKAAAARWAVRFEFREAIWLADAVSVHDARDARQLAVLSRSTRSGDAAFEGEAMLPAGRHAVRFRVVPHEPVRARVAPPTRLGWDDGFARAGDELFSWPVGVDVVEGGGGGARRARVQTFDGGEAAAAAAANGGGAGSSVDGGGRVARARGGKGGGATGDGDEACGGWFCVGVGVVVFVAGVLVTLCSAGGRKRGDDDDGGDGSDNVGVGGSGSGGGKADGSKADGGKADGGKADGGKAGGGKVGGGKVDDGDLGEWDARLETPSVLRYLQGVSS